MPLVKNTDQFPERPIVILLVGTPFSRKTSLASTAKNPILIDADRGADRAYGRPDTFVIKEGWGELETEDTQGLFNGYDTAILDTAKAILDDFLMEFVIGKNYKLRTNKMQMFGAIGDEFKLFVNKRRAGNMDIIIIAHDKTKDDDGVNIINPDITGGSKNLILRIADQVGYVSNKRIKRGEAMVDIVTVNFNPNETTPFCKNVAGLPELELPHFTDPRWKNFMDVEIVQPTKAAISKMTDEQRAALSLVEDWHNTIDALIPGEDDTATANALVEALSSISKIEPEHMKKQVRAYFQNHLKKIEWKYSGEVKSFIKADTKPKNETTPPAETKPEEKPATDQVNPPADTLLDAPTGGGIIPEPGTNGGSVVTPNPNIAPPKQDLFAPQGGTVTPQING